MMPSGIDCSEEDEDVVIAVITAQYLSFDCELHIFFVPPSSNFQGSELHEALSKMGYSDYEIVPITNERPSSDEPTPKVCFSVNK